MRRPRICKDVKRRYDSEAEENRYTLTPQEELHHVTEKMATEEVAREIESNHLELGEYSEEGEKLFAKEERMSETEHAIGNPGCSSATTSHRAEVDSGCETPGMRRNRLGIPRWPNCMFGEDTTGASAIECMETEKKGAPPTTHRQFLREASRIRQSEATRTMHHQGYTWGYA